MESSLYPPLSSSPQLKPPEAVAAQRFSAFSSALSALTDTYGRALYFSPYVLPPPFPPCQIEHAEAELLPRCQCGL